jgi:hypothetical protein
MTRMIRMIGELARSRITASLLSRGEGALREELMGDKEKWRKGEMLAQLYRNLLHALLFPVHAVCCVPDCFHVEIHLLV